MFRFAYRRDPEELNQLGEELGTVLNGVTFVLFGAVLLGPALDRLTLGARALRRPQPDARPDDPGADRDVGSGARPSTIGFLGWFGPRGLASIVFAVIVIEESHLPHEGLITLAIYLTVGLSVLAHGLTAAPLADRYGRWYERHPRHTMEAAPAAHHRARAMV